MENDKAGAGSTWGQSTLDAILIAQTFMDCRATTWIATMSAVAHRQQLQQVTYKSLIGGYEAVYPSPWVPKQRGLGSAVDANDYQHMPTDARGWSRR